MSGQNSPICRHTPRRRSRGDYGYTYGYASQSAPAKRAIGRLPEKVARVIVEYIYSTVAQNPQGSGHALHFELEGTSSARRGDFRVIFEINDEMSVVTITAIGHRSDVYRPR